MSVKFLKSVYFITYASSLHREQPIDKGILSDAETSPALSGSAEITYCAVRSLYDAVYIYITHTLGMCSLYALYVFTCFVVAFLNAQLNAETTVEQSYN